MAFASDPRLDMSKGIPMQEVLDRLGIAGLRRQGQEMVGPCPVCGGRDRFAVNLRSNLSNCRKCGLRAGDQVGLVQQVNGLSFRDALGWLMGEDVQNIDPAEIERKRAAARRKQAKAEADAARFRASAIARGRRFWMDAVEGAVPELVGYLQGRGLPGDILNQVAPGVLRLHPDLSYKRKIGGQVVELHRGPAMVAKIMGMAEPFVGAHCTWIDRAKPGAKARIATRMEENKGAPWPAKLIHGSQKGGAICLTWRKSPVLIVGEGIETTLTALAAAPIEGADYWAGISLGNMGGKMQRLPKLKHSGLPDMTDDMTFVPPPWVERLIFLQDGDSDPKATRAKLGSGLRRAMALRPGLHCEIVPAPKGMDFNDMVQRSAPQAPGAGAGAGDDSTSQSNVREELGD